MSEFFHRKYTLCIDCAGGVFCVCRKRYLHGFCMIALGIGILLGTWISSVFLCVLLGLMLMTIGCCVLRGR